MFSLPTPLEEGVLEQSARGPVLAHLAIGRLKDGYLLVNEAVTYIIHRENIP